MELMERLWECEPKTRRARARGGEQTRLVRKEGWRKNKGSEGIKKTNQI